MFDALAGLILAVLSLYNSVMFYQLSEEERNLLQSRWKNIVVLTLATIVILSIVSFVEIWRLYLVIIGKDTINYLAVYQVVTFVLILISIFLAYEIFSIKDSLKKLAPRIDMKAVVLVQGFAVLWLYLSNIEEKFSVLLYLFSISLKAVFIVSLILIVYVSFLLYRYFLMLKRGDIIVQLDFTSYLFQLSLAVSLFGFSILAQTTYCGKSVCAVLIATFGILMNNAISSLGRGIKQNVGGYTFEM